LSDALDDRDTPCDDFGGAETHKWHFVGQNLKSAQGRTPDRADEMIQESHRGRPVVAHPYGDELLEISSNEPQRLRVIAQSLSFNRQSSRGRKIPGLRFREGKKNCVLKLSVAKMPACGYVKPLLYDFGRLKLEHPLCPAAEEIQHLAELEFIASEKHRLMRLGHWRHSRAIDRREHYFAHPDEFGAGDGVSCEARTQGVPVPIVDRDDCLVSIY